MSHVAVIITSEKCGHCRTMRGAGRLLSQNEIRTEKKQPNIPGGNHYDAIFMKKLIMAETDSVKLRVINIHFKGFNPTEGIMDISVFTLDEDMKAVKQTMLKEVGGKAQMTIYIVGESGRALPIQDLPLEWNNVVKEYIPVNLSNYAMFYPSLIFFEGNAWTEGLKNGKPIYGHLNGFETRNEAPYGAQVVPGQNPNVMEFSKFLNQFFTGVKKLVGVPVNSVPEPVIEKVNETKMVEAKTYEAARPSNETNKNMLAVPTASAVRKLNYRLYVVEK